MNSSLSNGVPVFFSFTSAGKEDMYGLTEMTVLQGNANRSHGSCTNSVYPRFETHFFSLNSVWDRTLESDLAAPGLLQAKPGAGMLKQGNVRTKHT